MAATSDPDQLSSIERHQLQRALDDLADGRDVLELGAIVDASDVSPDAIRGVMAEQAADPFIPVEPIEDGVWRVED